MNARTTRPSSNIRGVLFDKDGTLIDFFATWEPIFREAARYAAGSDHELANRLLSAAGWDLRSGRIAANSPLASGTYHDVAQVFARILRLNRADEQRLAAEINRIFLDGMASHSVLLDGAADILAQLKGLGVKLAAVTNDTLEGLEVTLRRHRLTLLFDFTAGCDSGYGSKPDPGMLLAFCKKQGLAAAEVAVVGDSGTDMQMGRAGGAGLNVGVLSGTSRRDEFEGSADAVILGLRDLMPVLFDRLPKANTREKPPFTP